MMKCPRCHSPNPVHNKFCGECGTKLMNSSSPLKSVSDSERKQVTILFADVSGYTTMAEKLDPEEVRDIMGRIFGEVAKVVSDFQGFVEKFIGDAVVAFFGIPIVHEDDPVRAVRAAKEIHRLVNNISPEFVKRTGTPVFMHTGINSGLVVTGELNLKSGTHGIIGNAINLASRLSAIAGPDDIIVSSQTHKLIAPFFNTRPLDRVKLKGISGQVTPYLVLNNKTVKTRFEASADRGLTHFIGREVEKAKLKTCLKDSIAGTGQLITISGEAGVGKSRLIYEFRRAINHKSVIVLQGRCHSYGRDIPYFPFINALKRGLSLGEHIARSDLEKQAVENISAINNALVEYIPVYLHLLSIPSSSYPLPKAFHGQKLKSAIKQAISKIILYNTMHQPMVMVLEDWHWADEASTSTLKDLAGMMAGYSLMLIVLYRPEPDTVWLGQRSNTSFCLKTLDAGKTADIIKAAWSVRSLPQGFGAFVHDHTGGNPLFIEEILNALKEDGSVSIKDKKILMIRPYERLGLPDTVEAVIRARFDRLDNDTKKILQLAAVIGREFSFPVLKRVISFVGVKETLHQSLLGLEAQDLIQPVGRSHEPLYLFKHVLTQVAVYEGLLLKTRKTFHGYVGQAVEHCYAKRLEEQAETLAYHFSRSSDYKKAALYLEMAGDRASSVHSLGEARTYYESALSALDKKNVTDGDQETYISLTLKWAEVSQYAPSNTIRKALRRSLELAKKLNKKKRIAEVSYWGARFDYMQGDFIHVIPQVEQCISWADELDYHELLSLSLTIYGRSCLYTNEFQPGISYLEKGIEGIRSLEKWDDVVYSMGILGLLTALAGDFKNSIKTITKAIRIAREKEIPTFEAMVFGYMGSVQFWYGNWKPAINSCNECIKLSKKLGNVLPIIWATFFKGAALFSIGNHECGLTTMEQAINKMKELDSVLALRFFCSLFAEKLAMYGSINEAGIINAEAMSLSQSGQIWGEIINHRIKGFIEANRKDPDWTKVAMNMEKSIDMAERVGAATDLVDSCIRYASILETKGDTFEAKYYSHKAKTLGLEIGCRVDNRT